MRRLLLLALAGALLVPAAAAGGVAPGFVRTCDSRVESESLLGQATLPSEYRRNVTRIGPLVLAAGFADTAASEFAPLPGRPGRYDAAKVLVLARAGKPVTLVVGAPARGAAALLYELPVPGASGARGFRVADGERTVRFEPCEPDEPALVGPGTVGGWTLYNGGFVVAGARCVPLEAYVEGRARPFRASMSFGAGRCR